MEEKNKQSIFKKMLLIIPVILALIIFVMLVKSRKPPEKLTAAERIRTVRVIEAVPLDVAPRAIGYGYVEPAQEWQVVPQVSGKIVEISPSFKKGMFAKEDAVLLRIDPAEYRLAMAQKEANIQNIDAQLKELDLKEKNYATSLKIEQEALRLNSVNMKRNKKALAEHSVSHVQYEEAQLSYQAQLARVQEIQNSVKLIPSTRKALEAGHALNIAQLEQAKLDLSHTDIIVPFNCRITEISAEIGQFVQKGQAIGKADGTGAAEIAAQIPLNKMARLLRGVSHEAVSPLELRMDRIKDLFDLKVKVRLWSGDLQAEWEGAFARADAAIDSKTRTLGVIVVVDKPYKQVVIGVKPPLVRNMFCEVEITGQKVAGALIVPRSSLHDGHLFIVGREKRLERRPVMVDFAQADFYVIKKGLAEGEQVVTSDLVPAIEGMLLDPVPDRDAAERLKAQAAGETEEK